MNKHTLKKKHIIETAFQVWGEDFFYKTSLATLAKALGISKAALYRYFENKDALIKAMRDEFLEVHANICKKMHKEAEGKNFQQRLEIFQQKFLKFYAENFYHYRFAFVFLLPHTAEGFQQIEELRRLQHGVFPSAQLQEEFGWTGRQIPVVQRFIFSAGTFLLNRGNIKEKQDLHRLEVLDLTDFNWKILCEGMKGPAKIHIPDLEDIEKKCRLEEEDLLPKDPLFNAISTVVAEEGLWDASLENIARNAGMSKSSLYFYFQNRNEMLWKMIDRERHKLGSLFLDKIQNLNSFEEKLYAYLAIFTWYLARRPEFLAVLNWFRFQQFHIEVPHECKGGMEKYIKFIENGEQSGKLRTDLFVKNMKAYWINYLLIQEINNMYWIEGLSDRIWPSIRIVYKLFLFGVKGVEDEKK